MCSVCYRVFGRYAQSCSTVLRKSWRLITKTLKISTSLTRGLQDILAQVRRWIIPWNNFVPRTWLLTSASFLYPWCWVTAFSKFRDFTIQPLGQSCSSQNMVRSCPQAFGSRVVASCVQIKIWCTLHLNKTSRLPRLQDFIFVLRGKENLLAVMQMTNTNIHNGPDPDARHPPPPLHTHTCMYQRPYVVVKT